ncbi:MAG: DUF3093 domain-containing protein [Propioniciclava sp.]
MLFQERLRVPLGWWIIGILLGVTTITAIGFMMGPWVSASAGLGSVIVVAVFLLWIGGTRIRVDERGLSVGRSLLEWPYVGAVTALKSAETRALLGPDADARAFVVQRPWLPDAVQVEVCDPADPHPYWLVSTRSPAQCVAAIERARAGATTHE